MSTTLPDCPPLASAPYTLRVHLVEIVMFLARPNRSSRLLVRPLPSGAVASVPLVLPPAGLSAWCRSASTHWSSVHHQFCGPGADALGRHCRKTWVFHV